MTVLTVNPPGADYTFDIPSLIGNPGTAPLDFVVNENVQEVWVSLFGENQVGVFPAATEAPNITRIDTGSGPSTLAIDQKNYVVYAACDGNNTIR